MPTYISAHYSHTACGNGNTLKFDSSGYELVTTKSGHQVPFFKMAGGSVDTNFERLSNHLIEAVASVISQANLSKHQLKSTIILLGSTSLDVGTILPDETKEIWLTNTDRLSQLIVDHFGLNDFHLTVNTACTASVNAMIMAHQIIQSNQAEQVIVVGCEFINELTINGFYSLDLVSKNQLMTFSPERSGLILGEGVGVVLLSKHKPNKSCFFELTGSASGCDHHSLTMTQENGSHIVDIVSQCLASAGITANDIDLIKVHGTATLNNDESETNAFSALFSHTPIFALKPFIGHTLGACGSLELALMCELLNTSTPLPIPDYALLTPNDMLMPFVRDKTINECKHILLNHCGFGGNNAAVTLKVVNQLC